MPGNMAATDVVGAGRPRSRRESDRNPWVGFGSG